MSAIEEGSVVITGTGQAGSVILKARGDVWVLLRNSEIWIGKEGQVYLPQSKEELDATPLEYENRFEEREKNARSKK